MESFDVDSERYYDIEAQECNESKLMRSRGSLQKSSRREYLSGGHMISYVLIVAAVGLSVGSIIFLMKSVQAVGVAKDRHDEVNKKFDVTKPSQEKLNKVSKAYETLQGKYQTQRRRLMSTAIC